MTFQTFTGRQYLQIDIANNFGLDKLNWNERLDWFNQNEHQLDQLIQQAKEPALFYAGVKAYRDVLAKKPIGYMISLDATSSGLQILAALTGDPQTAALCNVVDTGQREDAYQGIYNYYQTKTGNKGTASKDDVKQAIMTAFYASKAVPRQVFGEGDQLKAFYETLSEMAPGAWNLNQYLLSLWNPSALEHKWTLPDNFHIHINVMAAIKDQATFDGATYDIFYNVNAPQPEGRSLCANITHSIDGMIVREITRRCDYDPIRIDYLYQTIASGVFGPASGTKDDQLVATLWEAYQRTGYLSARILDHLNAENMGMVNPNEIKDLLDSLPVKPFKVISIHDCFRCLPHYGNDLREQYRIQLELIAKSDLLQDLASQLANQVIQVTKIDPYLHKAIRLSNYALS